MFNVVRLVAWPSARPYRLSGTSRILHRRIGKILPTKNGPDGPEGPDMQLAETLNDATAPINVTSLDPYGQLIKMLMPRAQSIAIYDRIGLPVWLNDGLDAPELHRAAAGHLTREIGEDSRREGFTEAVDSEHSAHIFMLRDSGLGAAWLPLASFRANRASAARRALSRWCRACCARRSSA